ncbi:hypothetical protein FOPE_07735 [Fonsecaea pedrosoi]|nr:hypothetical protein FOPE_07735 [Fonsecaea pedrosoi]
MARKIAVEGEITKDGSFGIDDGVKGGDSSRQTVDRMESRTQVAGKVERRPERQLEDLLGSVDAGWTTGREAGKIREQDEVRMKTVVAMEPSQSLVQVDREDMVTEG